MMSASAARLKCRVLFSLDADADEAKTPLGADRLPPWLDEENIDFQDGRPPIERFTRDMHERNTITACSFTR